MVERRNYRLWYREIVVVLYICVRGVDSIRFRNLRSARKAEMEQEMFYDTVFDLLPFYSNNSLKLAVWVRDRKYLGALTAMNTLKVGQLPETIYGVSVR